MSRRPDFLKKWEKHPNRVKLEDLKPGDFFVIVDHDDWQRQHYGSSETIWRCSCIPKVENKYRNSLFCTHVGVSREYIGLQVTCIYNWFGPDPILIKLPKKQQTIYRALYKAVEANKETHELGWTDWSAECHRQENERSRKFAEAQRAKEKASS